MSGAQRQTLHALLVDAPLDLGGDIAEQRVIMHQLLTAHPAPADAAVTPLTLGGVPALSVTIAGMEWHDTILYLHGGGFALGSAESSVGLAADLARRSRMRVVTVDYRLAPEHPWPAAGDDVLAAYRGLLDDVDEPERIADVGESAGGNLVVTALACIRDAGLPVPAAGYVMSPWVDLAVGGGSVATKAEVDPALTGAALRRRAHDYLGEQDPASPAVSPIYADLRELPPLLIQVGSDEILLDDAVRLAARAAADGVRVVLDVVPEVPHVFQAFAALVDEGAEALDRAAVFLRDTLARERPA